MARLAGTHYPSIPPPPSPPLPRAMRGMARPWNCLARIPQCPPACLTRSCHLTSASMFANAARGKCDGLFAFLDRALSSSLLALGDWRLADLAADVQPPASCIGHSDWDVLIRHGHRIAFHLCAVAVPHA